MTHQSSSKRTVYKRDHNSLLLDLCKETGSDNKTLGAHCEQHDLRLVSVKKKISTPFFYDAASNFLKACEGQQRPLLLYEASRQESIFFRLALLKTMGQEKSVWPITFQEVNDFSDISLPEDKLFVGWMKRDEMGPLTHGEQRTPWYCLPSQQREEHPWYTIDFNYFRNHSETWTEEYL